MGKITNKKIPLEIPRGDKELNMGMIYRVEGCVGSLI
jgi:hypothetical protein